MDSKITRINKAIIRKYDKLIVKDFENLINQILVNDTYTSYSGSRMSFTTTRDRWGTTYFPTFFDTIKKIKPDGKLHTIEERSIDDLVAEVFQKPHMKVKASFSEGQVVLHDQDFYFREVLPIKTYTYMDLINYTLRFLKEKIDQFLIEQGGTKQFNDFVQRVFAEWSEDCTKYFMENTLGKYFAEGGKFQHSFKFLQTITDSYAWRKFRMNEDGEELVEAEGIWKFFLGDIKAQDYKNDIQIFETGYKWNNIPADASPKIEFQTKPLCKQTYKWKKEHNFIIGLSPEFIPELFIKYDETGKIQTGYITKFSGFKTNKSINQKMIDEHCMYYMAFQVEDKENKIFFRNHCNSKYYSNHLEELDAKNDEILRDSTYKRNQKLERIKNSRGLTNALKNGKEVKSSIESYLNALSSFYTFDWKNKDSLNAMKFISSIGEELLMLNEAIEKGKEGLKTAIELPNLSPWEISYAKGRIEDSIKRLANSLEKAKNTLNFSK